MKSYLETDIFKMMNRGNAIVNQIKVTTSSLNSETIMNPFLANAMNLLYKNYRDGISLKLIDAVKNMEIYVVHLPIDKRLPANMPYVKIKIGGSSKVIVDISKYSSIQRTDTGKIEGVEVDIQKLYNLLVPAYIALKVLNPETVVSIETTKWLSYLWARMFNRILMTQKMFVANQERYEAYMYFAMRFFMKYYMQTNDAIVDKVSNEFIKNVKSKYILMIESKLQQKQIDLYQNWMTFTTNMFSDEITNIKITNVSMNIDQYIRLFCTYLGRDGAYLSLWSADLFFFCLFVTYNHAWILNDRAWNTIMEDNPKVLPRILNGLYREI